MFSFVVAAVLSLPVLPPAEYADTEVATNISLPAVCAESRVFSFRFELDATLSNNVSLVFGRDVDNDGVLSRSEDALEVGWDCGLWKVVDCVSGEETTEQGAPGQIALDWRLIAVPGAAPRSLAVSVGGVHIFVALAANPPRFLFDAEWNMVKVVCRGLDAPSPQIDCSVESAPMTIRIR